MKSAYVVAASALVIGLAALGGIGFVLVARPAVGPPGTLPTKGVEVKIVKGSVVQSQEQNFVPRNIVVVLGFNDTVRWTNDDTYAHTVTSLGNFDSLNLNTGDTWTHTFIEPGIFTYVCSYHPWMKGTITVKSAGT